MPAIGALRFHGRLSEARHRPRSGMLCHLANNLVAAQNLFTGCGLGREIHISQEVKGESRNQNSLAHRAFGPGHVCHPGSASCPTSQVASRARDPFSPLKGTSNVAIPMDTTRKSPVFDIGVPSSNKRADRIRWNGAENRKTPKAMWEDRQIGAFGGFRGPDLKGKSKGRPPFFGHRSDRQFGK